MTNHAETTSRRIQTLHPAAILALGLVTSLACAENLERPASPATRSGVPIAPSASRTSSAGMTPMAPASPSPVPEPGTKQEEEWMRLFDLTMEVHSLLDYGEVTATVTNQLEIEEHGVGHCGHFSYLLSQRLTELGYVPRIWSATGVSSYVVHAVVEVDDRYVLDPTLGIAYPTSFADLWSNPDKAQYFLGDYADLFGAYAGEAFFSNIRTVTVNSVQGSLFSAPLEARGEFSRTKPLSTGKTGDLIDDDMATIGRSNAREIGFSWTWSSPARASYFSIVAENETSKIGYDFVVSLRREGQIVWQESRTGPEMKYGAIGVVLPDTVTFDRLDVLFSREPGGLLPLAIRDFHIVGELE